MIRSNLPKEVIQKDTRVLFQYKNSNKYLLSNDSGTERKFLRVFAATKDGKIITENLLLGSLFANDPEMISDLVEMECTFEKLNSSCFNRDPVVDGLIGLAVGDVFGVPVEFMSRDEVRKLNLQDMIGNDCPLDFTSRWNRLIPSGAWSDDTSMTLAAMSSIISHSGMIDYDDIMNQF